MKCFIKGCNETYNLSKKSVIESCIEDIKCIEYQRPVCEKHKFIPQNSKWIKYCTYNKKYYRYKRIKKYDHFYHKKILISETMYRCELCKKDKFIHSSLGTKICFDCLMATKIQKWWLNIYWNPKSKICEKRLNKQYNSY